MQKQFTCNYCGSELELEYDTTPHKETRLTTVSCPICTFMVTYLYSIEYPDIQVLRRGTPTGRFRGGNR